MLKATRLKKQFKDTLAVDGLDIEVKENTILGLLGPNGAGKTTTINMIIGLLKPDEGEVFFQGKSISKDIRVLQKNLGYVPQEISLFQDLTALDNMLFWGQAYGLSNDLLKERVKALLEETGLTEHSKKKVKDFSGGMKRRLNIGVALLHEPKFIVMDEPTVGIDPQSRQYILDLIKSRQKKGSTILYTSHYIDEVEQLCEEIVIMDHGKTIAKGTKDELINQVSIGEELIATLDKLDNIEEYLKSNGTVSSYNIDSDTNVIHLNIDKGQGISNKIISDLTTKGYGIRSLEIKKPSLESVFLELTGKSLRD